MKMFFSLKSKDESKVGELKGEASTEQNSSLNQQGAVSEPDKAPEAESDKSYVL